MAPLQSHHSWKSRPGPIRCAESPRAIRFPIALLALPPQAKTSPIFGIHDRAARVFTTFEMLTLQSAGLWG